MDSWWVEEVVFDPTKSMQCQKYTEEAGRKFTVGRAPRGLEGGFIRPVAPKPDIPFAFPNPLGFHVCAAVMSYPLKAPCILAAGRSNLLVSYLAAWSSAV
jgi:hypothetical protein